MQVSAQVNQIANMKVQQAAVNKSGIMNGLGSNFSVLMTQLMSGQVDADLLTLNLGENSNSMSEDDLENAMQLLAGLFVDPQILTDNLVKDEQQSSGNIVSTAAGQQTAMLEKSNSEEKAFEIVKNESDLVSDPNQNKSNTTDFSKLKDFQSTLADIKKQIKQSSNVEKSEIDIDSLQQAVSGGKFMSSNINVKSTIQSSSELYKDIMNQVKEGITENIQNQKNEFVIKLKPEGLGEVTVKMMESGGKISLSIITSNQQAQNALSSEISNLRDALRPHNAEISEVISAQDNFSRQGFGEEKQNQPNNDRPKYYNDTQEEDVNEKKSGLSDSSALNRYI